MKHSRTSCGVAAVTLALAAASALAGCGSSGGGTDAKDAKVVSGATLTLAVDADPGSLDPQRSVSGSNLLLNTFAYDTPVKVLDNGQVTPEVVTAWKPGSKSYALTVRKGVTCADGTPMDAKVVADNINYVGDAKNESPMAGSRVPVGTTATADAAASTVAVKLPVDAPFFMQNIAELPLVCAKGLTNRGTLKATTDGSGPYVLAKAVPGDHYDYVLRKGYTWGPKGQTTASEGIPAKVTFKVVTSPTTTANLLISGQLGVAAVQGSETTRLKAAGLFHAGGMFMGQEVVFNQTPDQAVSDVAVRRALIQGLNLADLAKVDTGGLGKPANGTIADPKICGGDTMKGFTPAFDLDGAKAALDQAGWTAGAGGIRAKDGKRLAVELVYPNETPTTAATAQYLAGQWKQLGADVKLNERSFDQTSAVVFGKGAWGATLIGLGVSNPATLVPFFSGPAPTKGNNFGHFNNKQYDASVSTAQGKDGTAGCADWNAAESALFKDADITPISNKPLEYYGKKARFEVLAHYLIPTSLRVLAG
ncbi:hypothetical protein DSM104299_03896 [Baekduia alba]|uniref:ABC transporter substrate-binding protein n=1 Tax=Baekduia alba TaxID=2997333 RepID=UPI00234204D4|nr:ABC transporter substrate-binding protein [Baekduia alba]WCB95154.1 hypothetical protein DSM104299_03896 [Baekduia alba]